MNRVLVTILLVTMIACGNSTSTHLQNPNGKGPAPVDLKSASSFAVLTKSGITDVPTSVIVGDVGTSPITGAANHLTCAEVTGKTYSVDAAGPLPCLITNATSLTTAIHDMMTAYTNAAGRTLPTAINLGGGAIGGLTIAPGLYKWGTGVNITTDVTLSGGPNDVWIFQIAQTLDQASATNVVLSGGAQAKNVFWQTFGDVTIQANAQFNGVILSQTAINLKTGASVNGQLLAQTQVTLEQNAVTE
jgi:hypothetical protein